jgi:hypothetical protein
MPCRGHEPLIATLAAGGGNGCALELIGRGGLPGDNAQQCGRAHRAWPLLRVKGLQAQTRRVACWRGAGPGEQTDGRAPVRGAGRRGQALEQCDMPSNRRPIAPPPFQPPLLITPPCAPLLTSSSLQDAGPLAPDHSIISASCARGDAAFAQGTRWASSGAADHLARAAGGGAAAGPGGEARSPRSRRRPPGAWQRCGLRSASSSWCPR